MNFRVEIDDVWKSQFGNFCICIHVYAILYHPESILIRVYGEKAFEASSKAALFTYDQQFQRYYMNHVNSNKYFKI